jgi:hypothetical protein
VSKIASGTDVEAAAGTTTEGWWAVTLPAKFASADFLATVDVDECAGENLCEKPEDGGACANTDGGYLCVCTEGYESDHATHPHQPGETYAPGEAQCVVKLYSAPNQNFLLYHADAATYGLHVAEVQIFESSAADGTCLGRCDDGSLSGDCHYSKAAGSNGDSSNTKITNIKVSGSYPGHAVVYDGRSTETVLNDHSYDGPDATTWWSAKLALDRKEGTGAWISFEVDGETEVGCVRVILDCSKGPREFTLHRGKVGPVSESAAFASSGLSFADPGVPGWSETVTKTRGQHDLVVDLAIPCGIENAQYFGEKFRDYAKPVAGATDMGEEVSSPCECQQLCLDHIDEGCATWKYYRETRHCFLQKDIFEGADPASIDMDNNNRRKRASQRSRYEPGTGWWKRPFTTGWPGWVTGVAGPLARTLTVDPPVPTVGETFSVTVGGVGFPFNDEYKDDLGARQRIKIIAADKNCVEDLPPQEVEGVDCSNSHTCSPKPAAYGRTHATWEYLRIAKSKEATDYQVCWCHAHCWQAANWQQVPGKIALEASPYSWRLEAPADDYALVDEFTRLKLATSLVRVSRPAFSSNADKDDWRIKLVKDLFDCSTLADTKLCDGGDDCGAHAENETLAANCGPDQAMFAFPGSDADTGDYHVCFSEDGGAEYFAIPSANSRYLTVTGLDSDASRPRGPFHHQHFSGKAGTTAKITVQGYRMYTPAQASIAIVPFDKCIVPDGENTTVLATLSVVSSTADAYVFEGDLPEEMRENSDGTYSVCLCDGPSDATLTGAGSTYTVETSQAMTADATLHAAASSDSCSAKCSAGCLAPPAGSFGESCGCGGNDADLEAVAEALCLDAAGCRAACSADLACTGYTVHRTLDRCFLHSADSNQTADNDHDLWTKSAGLACQEDEDFFGTDAATAAAATLGKLHVTHRVDVGVDYIATPGQVTSLELTGSALDFQNDRVMVIDCFGTCGVTGPSGYATVEPDFPGWVAENDFIDLPSLDGVPPLPKTFDPYAYVVTENRYCPGNALNAQRELQDSHKCHKKCFENAPCEGDSCFCDGYFPGYDTEDSSALCLDTAQCEDLCSQTDDCHSIDMHKTKNRCFLNTDGCAALIPTQLTPSTDYDLHVKQLDQNTRRLMTAGKDLTADAARKLLAVRDPGLSWGSVLRFKGMTLSSGGEFKVCFCDSDLLPAGHTCKDPEDFSVEVGKLHATGLQCLLSNPKMTRGTCVEQEHGGGLRCYAEGQTVPTVAVPDDYLAVPSPNPPRPDLATMLMAFCQYGDAREVMAFSFCAQYRRYADEQAANAASP